MLKEVLITGALGLSLAAAPAFAGSKAQVSVNGKSITVYGGSGVNVQSVNGNAVIKSGDFVMNINGSILKYDDETIDVGSYDAIVIRLGTGDPEIEVDGEKLAMADE